jgi:hypothetical protein
LTIIIHSLPLCSRSLNLFFLILLLLFGILLDIVIKLSFTSFAWRYFSYCCFFKANRFSLCFTWALFQCICKYFIYIYFFNLNLETYVCMFDLISLAQSFAFLFICLVGWLVVLVYDDVLYLVMRTNPHFHKIGNLFPITNLSFFFCFHLFYWPHRRIVLLCRDIIVFIIYIFLLFLFLMLNQLFVFLVVFVVGKKFSAANFLRCVLLFFCFSYLLSLRLDFEEVFFIF